MIPIYYAPSTEDFYYGFEFEVYNDPHKYCIEGQSEGWKQISMGMGGLGNIINIQKLILDKQIRVKFLDAQDILDLGYNATFSGYCIKDRIFIQHVPVSEFNNIPSIRIYKSSTLRGGFDREYFVGTVKNKSELKKIISQISL
jgi:hypothetical protein